MTGRSGRERRSFERFRKRALAFWLLVVTGLLVLALFSLQRQTNELREQRREGTAQRCELARLGLQLAGPLPQAAGLRANYDRCVKLLRDYGGGDADLRRARTPVPYEK